MLDVVRGSILILMFRGSSFVKNFIIAKSLKEGGQGAYIVASLKINA